MILSAFPLKSIFFKINVYYHLLHRLFNRGILFGFRHVKKYKINFYTVILIHHRVNLIRYLAQINRERHLTALIFHG